MISSMQRTGVRSSGQLQCRFEENLFLYQGGLGKVNALGRFGLVSVIVVTKRKDERKYSLLSGETGLHLKIPPRPGSGSSGRPVSGNPSTPDSGWPASNF